MLSERKVQNKYRYLVLLYQVDNDYIKHSKERTYSLLESKKIPSDRWINNFLDWEQSEREKAFFSDLAYADLKIPKSFGCVFDVENPEINFQVKMTLTQSIFMTQFPIDRIEHGDRHLVVLKFDVEVPHLISELSFHNDYSNNSMRLGICQLEDFELIKKELLLIRKLKQQHGKKWWNYHFD